ncbi:type VII secretion protein EssC [Anaerosacchariphilus polymeriproducens]|uniref:Type VII secretion protein EssC n=1 Tax=Anaerosacchariphilus polymeriproducens TaxID=1812858 RepID=A0A371AXI1_9FIRM|nr:type VII secretion protein EssC [Anaerosacchariphilus polymeriproducens]RDU24232.1 type VII secretion protein EssC [Anaerosacchariphilus polymeriproducens]
MRENYKIILTGNNLYQEFTLTEESKPVIRIGNIKGCDIRFRKELFFEEFSIKIRKTDTGWAVEDEKNTFITQDEIAKLYSREMRHGDELWIKSQRSIPLFQLLFSIDFDKEIRNYQCEIDISQVNEFQIGGRQDCHIFLKDELVGQESIEVRKNGDSLEVDDKGIRIGVYVNGTIIRSKTLIKEYDFFMLSGYSFYFKGGKLYTTSDQERLKTTLPFEIHLESQNHMEYPYFIRNTRIQYELPDEKIDILSVDAKPDVPNKNPFLRVLPLLLSLFIMVGLRSMMGGSGMFVIYSGAMVGVGLLTTIITMITDKKDYKQKVKEREEDYAEYIEKKKSDIQKKQNEEKELLEKTYLETNENLRLVKEFDKRLFEKDMEHKDFLQVRIGHGCRKSGYEISIHEEEKKNTKDPLQEIPEQLKEEYEYLDDAPLVTDLNSNNAIGVVGKKEWLWNFGRTLTVDIVTRHYHNEVKLFYIFEGDEIENYQWIKWLLHVNSKQYDRRNIVCDKESKNVLLEFIYNIITNRNGGEKSNSKTFDTKYIVFVYDTQAILDHPISKYIKNANECGFTFVFFTEYEEFLPYGCKEVIRLVSEKEGKRIVAEKAQDIDSFIYESVEDTQIKRFARKMSPIYIKEVNLDSELTKNITLYQMLKIFSVQDINYGSNWANSKVYETMAAPLGVRMKNELVFLDLHEKYHGPHGLVAGTTGSGKSEILQSYILSMAIQFHPYDVGFVLIDFKGGGMLNQFKQLPHLMGTITNIDGREIDRSLKSIKAELLKRQSVFSEYNVNHIDQYIKLCKSGKGGVPLPHLIIIVDEFAELKTEYPDFMKELISAARIGRSLGVHLILATQKPSGVVDAQIWSNSKFKLCLKVQTKEDSNEVLKTGLAAEIVEPGRAYLQVGNNEIFELFQSAYSGASVSGFAEVTNEFELSMVDFGGRRKVIYSNKNKKKDKEAITQLDAIVESLHDYCEDNQIELLSGICLKPLETQIFLSELKPVKKDLQQGILLNIGIYDDPEMQVQEEVVLDISSSNTFIAGSAMTGKTTMLQTILYALVENYSPQEVNVYILDFGTMALKVFEKAHQVGGVILSSEEERIKNFIKMMDEEMVSRKIALLEKNVGTFSAYKEAGYSDLPQVLIFVDNVVAFKEYYQDYFENFMAISREGLSLGINLILTSSQSNALNYKMMANFGTRFSLVQNEKGDYSSLFERCKMEPRETEGRGLFMMDKRILEFQTALCVEGEKEFIRNEKIAQFIQEMNQQYENQFAKPIPEVPKVLNVNELMRFAGDMKEHRNEIPFAIDFSTISMQYVKMLTAGIFGIMGRDAEKRYNLVRYLIEYLNNKNNQISSKIYVIDGVQRQLQAMENLESVVKYSFNPRDIESILNEVAEILENRKKELYENPESLEDAEFIVILLENSDVFEEFEENFQANDLFKNIVQNLKKYRVLFIFSDVPNIVAGYGTPESIKLIRAESTMVMFENLNLVKMYDFSVKTLRENTAPLQGMEGYLIQEGEMEKVKVVDYEGIE